MTDIATKNGQVIVRNDLAAEDCRCCGDICVSLPQHLRLHVNGMPNVITGGISLGYAARSPADDNGSEYTLFRATRPRYGTYQNCKWRGGPHGFWNRLADIYEEQAIWVLDGANDRLYGYGRTFAPPEGASFRQVPYTDERPLRVVSPTFDLASDFGSDSDWANVVVSIGTGKSSSAICRCPFETLDEGTICASTDLSPGFAPTPCSTSAGSACVTDITDLQLSVTAIASFTEYRQAGSGANPEDGSTTEWRTFSSDSQMPPQYNADLSFLSGDYSAPWLDVSSIRPTAIYPYGAPDGWHLVSQGYRFFAHNPTFFGLSDPNLVFGNYLSSVFLAIAIRPTAFKWTNQSPTLTRCGDGKVSWGVHCVLFDAYYNSTLGAFPANFVHGSYAAAPCSAYSCGDAPSLSVSMTGPIHVRLNPQNYGPWTEIRGTVSFSVST